MENLIIIFLILISYCCIRNLYYDRLLIVYRRKLSDIKSRLEELMDLKNISSNDWYLQYFHSLVSIRIKDLDSINIFVSIISFILYPNLRDETKVTRSKFLEEIEKRKNIKLLEKEFNEIMVEYIRKKHFITIFLLKHGINLVLRYLERFNSVKKYIINYATLRYFLMPFNMKTPTLKSKSFTVQH